MTRVMAMIDGKMETVENPEYILRMIDMWAGRGEGCVGTCTFGGGRKRTLRLTEYIVGHAQCPMEVKHEI